MTIKSWRDYLTSDERLTVAESDGIYFSIKKLLRKHSHLLRMRTLIMNRCMQRKRYDNQARKPK